MATLQNAQPPPGEGWLTTAEVECRFLATRAGGEGAQPGRPPLLYQDIYVDSEISLVDSSEDHTHHFLPITEHWTKRTLNTWRNKGILSALEDLAGNQDISGSSLATLVSSFLSMVHWGAKTTSWFTPNSSALSVPELVAKYSDIADWENAPIRAMALHPRMPFIALATRDDAIELKPLSQGEQGFLLRDKNQKLVCCLKWAPHCDTLLAAGTSCGVLLWNVDLLVSSSRFLTSWVRVESSPHHSPVCTISWSPLGNFLVSGSPGDTNLIVWDIPMGVATRVRRTEGGGVSLVAMATQGQRVFAASMGHVMRVWETETWTCEKWSHLIGRCTVACWSPAGQFLLFALEGDQALYYLSFLDNTTQGGPVSAVKCADLSPCSHVISGQEVMVGGCVQTMSWDPTGERLAVIFTPTSPSPELVAVFRTRHNSSMLDILPGGFIRGEEGDLPHLVTFQQNCSQGALLATAWMSGRVSFTPLLFTSTLHPPHFPSSTTTTHSSLLTQSQTPLLTQSQTSLVTQSQLYSTT